jgi:hypothetical protein
VPRKYRFELDLGGLVEGHRVVLRGLSVVQTEEQAEQTRRHGDPLGIAEYARGYIELGYEFVPGIGKPEGWTWLWECDCEDDVGTEYTPGLSAFSGRNGASSPGDRQFMPCPPADAKVLIFRLRTAERSDGSPPEPAGAVRFDLVSGELQRLPPH